MAKLTLSDLADLRNQTTAVNTLNTNNARIETALENTLSRDGTTPNQMSADLDMNSNDIINVGQVEAETLLLDGIPFSIDDADLVGGVISVVAGNGISVDSSNAANPVVSASITQYQPEWYGAVGDGATNDQTAVDDAIEAAGYGGEVWLQDTYLVGSFNNPYGVIFRGPGKIVTNVVSGSQWQRNTYANNPGRFVYGIEYMHRAYAYLATNATLNAFFFGDSTMAGGFGEYRTPDQVWLAAMRGRDIQKVAATNLGVGETKWSDLNYAAYLGVNNGLFFIQFGVNDAGYGLDATYADAEAKLAAIRSAGFGNLGALSIVIVGPNSTSDSLNLRDERFYEKYTSMMIALARKYQCVYIDVYAMMQDSRNAAGYWMDDPYADGRAIHPINAMNDWKYGAITDALFSKGMIEAFRNNYFTNHGASTKTLLHSAIPSTYANGIDITRATTANGWPLDGAVVTIKNVDTVAIQTLFSYGAFNQFATRTANIGSDVWNAWTGIPTAVSTFQNSWVAAGGSYPAPTVVRTNHNTVVLTGAVAGGTTTAGTIILRIPTGFFPSTIQKFTGTKASSATTVALALDADGYLSIDGTADATLTTFYLEYFA